MHRIFGYVLFLIIIASADTIPTPQIDTLQTIRKLEFIHKIKSLEAKTCEFKYQQCKVAYEHQEVFLNPIITVSNRIPATSYWKQYQTAGLYLEIPALIKKVHCIIGGEAGRMRSKDGAEFVNCVHLQFGLAYEYHFLFNKRLSLLPMASITNTVINHQYVSTIIEKRDVFNNIDDEFGINLGVEPRLNFQHFFIGIPIKIERSYTSPSPFDLLLISLNVGYKISL
jgi:hypothetical protein